MQPYRKEEKVGKEINGEVMVASVNKENITKAEYDRVLEDVQDTFKAYYGEEFFLRMKERSIRTN